MSWFALHGGTVWEDERVLSCSYVFAEGCEQKGGVLWRAPTTFAEQL
jgi:hypothetical protein